MGELFVMRRANGDLFTEEVEGRLRIPVWSSREAAVRYKARNPELGVFLPAKLDRSLLKRTPSLEAGSAEFYLLSEDDPDADLYDGRPIPPEEVFPEGESTLHAAP